MQFTDFFKNKKVFITGHTGFKGSWASLWLQKMGAKVTGYSLEPPTNPSLFELAHVAKGMKHIVGDVRDYAHLLQSLQESSPEIVIHMAAQPIVRESYKNPVETYSINLMGTVHLLQAIREIPSVRSVVNVTTDKCYENREWVWGYRENEPMGGYDPYSNSKGCSELATASFRNSFFAPAEYGKKHHVCLATVRAGNVVGGGDWAVDRLIPDCMKAVLRGESVFIRNPNSVRPWQHVLEALAGYLTLAQALYEGKTQFAEGWNFGPDEADAKPVEWLVKKICQKWGQGASYKIDAGPHPHEANYLKLDCSKAKAYLQWFPRWNLDKALDKIIEWFLAYQQKRDMQEVSLQQIQEYEEGR